ncbi:pepsin-like aspartyl protease [Enterovibrio makurazakiensis]|uniref:avidin/streptavidin family protein n=1 Tax=Enterovibrio makurazakiensis TaxID=2910232 RepID=UPI003D24962A
MPLTLEGTWQNEFGSLMTLKQTENNGITCLFTGSYTSHTGETGAYQVNAVSDALPTENGLTVSINVLWKNLAPDAKPSEYDHALSSFTGQLQLVNGDAVINTTYLLVSNTAPADDWGATIIDKSTFRRVPEVLPKSSKYDTENTACIRMPLHAGTLTENGATPWYTTLKIGTPGQTLKLMVDTGTTHTWLTSTLCNTAPCLLHERYSPTQSSSYKAVDAPIQQIDFGPWGSMDASLGIDLISLDNNNNPIQVSDSLRFYMAQNYKGSKFAELACDGGLSIPSILPVGIDSSELLPQLRNEMKIGWPIASFCFNENDKVGEVILGAVDTNKFREDTLNICALIDANSLLEDGLSYLWTIALDSLTLTHNEERTDKSVLCDFIFAVDTGSSFFKGNKQIIDKIVASITQEGSLPEKVYAATPDFEKYPNITFAINGSEYVLTPEQYFVRLEDGVWRLGFDPLDGLPDGFLLAGSLFLNPIYSIFYYQTNSCSRKAIGLAEKY